MGRQLHVRPPGDTLPRRGGRRGEPSGLGHSPGIPSGTGPLHHVLSGIFDEVERASKGYPLWTTLDDGQTGPTTRQWRPSCPRDAQVTIRRMASEEPGPGQKYAPGKEAYRSAKEG